jgi:hypothetical protein
MMEANSASADYCPHCHHALEIIAVKFKLTGAAIISACANCAMAMAENSNKQELNDYWGAITARVGQRLAGPRSPGRVS